MSNAVVSFTLPGAAVRILREGSPGQEIEDAWRSAGVERVGRGSRRHFAVTVSVASEIAEYLASVAGVVGEMAAGEREGGREHAVAADAVRRIEAAVREVSPRYEVTLRPAFSGGPNRLRIIRAESLRHAQDLAVARWPVGQVFHVRRAARSDG